MSDTPPPANSAVRNREEMIRDLANRHGVMPGDYEGRLKDLGLEEMDNEIEVVDPAELDL